MLRLSTLSQPNQLPRFLLRPEDRHAWDLSAHHGHFVAAMQPRAVLTILEDFIGKIGLIFYDSKAIFEKKVGNTRE